MSSQQNIEGSIVFTDAQQLWIYLCEELDFVVGGTISEYWTLDEGAPANELEYGIEIDMPIVFCINGRQLPNISRNRYFSN